MASGCKLKMSGWAEYIEKLERAGKKIDPIAQECAEQSAKIAEAELTAAASQAGVDSDLVSEIETKINQNGNTYEVSVGWKKGVYDAKRLSTGYKMIFLNYGTGRRQTKLKLNRGKMSALGFIQSGKKEAAKNIKKLQRKKVKELLKG